jgi:hypothetical protein
MRSAYTFLLSSILLFSCTSSGTKNRTDSLVLPAFKRLDTLVPFSGVWVNAIYTRRIHRNRSPRMSQDVGESCIIIPARTLQVTRMVGGFHDGAEDIVIVKNGDRFEFYSADLTRFRKTIQPISDNELQIGDQFFIRLKNPDTTLADWGILEEHLFQGRYTDQLGRSIVFTSNGHVSGLDSFSYYMPQIDYTELNAPVDHIELGQSSRHTDEFGFRFDKDSLLIYTINCLRFNVGENECDSEVLGNRLYTLVQAKE